MGPETAKPPGVGDADGGRASDEAIQRASPWLLVGVFAVSASTLLVEVAITKFFSSKVHYHYTYVIISTVIFGFGVAGVYVFLRSRRLGKRADASWSWLSNMAAVYSIAIIVAVIVFCWLPIDPAAGLLKPWVRKMSLPIYFVLFAIPMFFAGVCVSYTLTVSTRPVMTIYFWDLLGAAVGAALCPLLLVHAGGYGSIAIAALLGMAGALAFGRIASQRREGTVAFIWTLFVVALGALLFYPGWAQRQYGFDIRSSKDYGFHEPFLADFQGIKSTYWNAVARVDISHTARSSSYYYLYGLAESAYDLEIPGRLILLDGGANTRQFRVNGPIDEQSFLGDALWASGYIARPNPERVLVIGGGGGIDILVAKYFGTPEIHVAEINPAVYANLTGQSDDPDRDDYLPWYVSDETSQVTVHQSEGRYFSTTQPDESFDLIQGSAVDTLTATTAGGKALAENYLYTLEAVDEFYRLLRPGGVLSLTHWRFPRPTMALRMFLTYLECMEAVGSEEPWKHVVVIGGGWTDSLLKKSPFTESELEVIRRWVEKTGRVLLFDPYRRTIEQPNIERSEWVYSRIGFLDSERRDAILESYPFEVRPVTDDRPYFYDVNKSGGIVSLFNNNKTVLIIFLGGVAAAFALAFLPLILAIRGGRSSGRSRRLVQQAVFFALCGFAFLLYETAIISRFAVFVGGPLYSLSVVLVSVLTGYAAGSWFARYLRLSSATFAVLGVLLLGIFVFSHVFLPGLIRAAMPLPFPWRIACCAVFTLIVTICTALPVTLAMNAARMWHGSVVAWMWGVSSAFNVLGALSFVPLTHIIGVSNTILLVGVIYLIANVGFAFSSALREPTTPEI